MEEEKALLAFFYAPGFNEMTNEEALRIKLQSRFFNAVFGPVLELQISAGQSLES